MNINFIFHVFKLNSMTINSYFNQIQLKQQTTEINENIAYEVKKTLDSKRVQTCTISDEMNRFYMGKICKLEQL